jgi:hypothetical protein
MPPPQPMSLAPYAMPRTQARRPRRATSQPPRRRRRLDPANPVPTPPLLEDSLVDRLEPILRKRACEAGFRRVRGGGGLRCGPARRCGRALPEAADGEATSAGTVGAEFGNCKRSRTGCTAIARAAQVLTGVEFLGESRSAFLSTRCPMPHSIPTRSSPECRVEKGIARSKRFPATTPPGSKTATIDPRHPRVWNQRDSRSHPNPCRRLKYGVTRPP